jgi:hypothetical protein
VGFVAVGFVAVEFEPMGLAISRGFGEPAFQDVDCEGSPETRASLRLSSPALPSGMRPQPQPPDQFDQADQPTLRRRDRGMAVA